MGYENKINRLLCEIEESLMNVVIEVYQKDKKEYTELDNAFNDGLLAIKDYTRNDFVRVIENSYFGKVWNELSQERKTEILDELEPIFIREKEFSDYIENSGPICY